MPEPYEDKLIEILAAGRPAPHPDFTARAAAALSATPVIHTRTRLQAFAFAAAGLLIVIAILQGIYAIAGFNSVITRGLTVQQQTAGATIQRFVNDMHGIQEQPAPDMPILNDYRRRASGFVHAHYPDDPEMLMAAGSLTQQNANESLALLRKAALFGKRPVYWAAYLNQLQEKGPQYRRIGSYVYDLDAGPERLAAVNEQIRRGYPNRLTPDQVAPMLADIKAWQASDPDNALPVAMQMWYAYGLHDDTEAFALWQKAASKGSAKDYARARQQAVARLLTRMGMGEIEAIAASNACLGRSDCYELLRDCANIAQYEGGQAFLDNRPDEAIIWWHSTIAIGRNLQNIDNQWENYLAGISIESIGAAPTWRWYRLPLDTVGTINASTAATGPLYGGRYYFGPQHEFYVSEAGLQSDTRLRTELLQNEARVALLAKGPTTIDYAGLIQLKQLLFLAIISFMLLVLLLLSYLAIGLRIRRSAGFTTVRQAALCRFLFGAVIVCALSTIVLGFAGSQLRARWIRNWYSPNYREMHPAIEVLGDKWQHPPLPTDAWRAKFTIEEEMIALNTSMKNH
jgi:hypothetical protein